MTADHQPDLSQAELLRKLGFNGPVDLLTKDLREPANDEAHVTPVHRVGLYGGGLR